MLFFKATALLSVVTSALAFFEWKNCVKPIKEPVPKTVKVHGCEDQKEFVSLSCAPGTKIAVTKAFFGHGHSYKATCDSSWISQNCGTKGVKEKVKLLCQEKQSCKISPTEDVLGDTSCMFGLDADLFIEYVCNPVYVNDVLSITSMNMTPSPLILPGKIGASISLLVERHLASTTKLKLDIEKKVLGAAWISIPCVSNYGSCTYDNFCEILRSVMFSKCDEEMENKGIPCDCPIPTGLFSVPTQTITVTKEQIDKIPSALDWFVEGKYRVTAEFLDVYDRHLGCIQLQVEVDINTKRKRNQLEHGM